MIVAEETGILDFLLTGGRLVDPASGIDGPHDVGIRGDQVAWVGGPGAAPPPASRRLDVTGLVVAPGFVDLHSHAQSPTGLRLQALDGVTTALDLEAGTLPVPVAYRAAEREGRPIDFGFAASWALARLHVMDGVELPTDASPAGALEVFQRNQRRPRWHGLATDREIDAILDLVAEGVGQGAIGVGVLLGYSPGSGRDEYFRLAQRAETLGVPVFTHARRMSNVEPDSSLDGTLEILGAAAGTGAAMHICHVNSTSLRRIDEVADAIVAARARGNRVTTEAYPYATSSTGIGAPFLAPDELGRMGITPSDIRYLPTGERVRDAAELTRLRAEDPGGLCLVDYLDATRDADVATLLRALTLPDAAIASDAMPLVREGRYDVHDEWPLGPGALVHPRSLGCFARTLRWLVRETRTFTLSEAIRRCTVVPVSVLADAVPAMRAKGRLDVGADADLVVFDPDTVTDLAGPTSPVPSTGFRYVMVHGELVVSDGVAVPGAAPGRPIRGA